MTSDLESLKSEYVDAIAAKDARRLAALYDDGLRVFDAWEQWLYDDLTQWWPVIEGWLGSLGDENVHATFEDERTVVRGDIGYFSAIVTFAAVDPDAKILRSLQERLTWVVAKTDGAWKILHQHSSAPIGFANKTAILHRS